MARQRSAEELRVLREEFWVKANATFDQMFGQDGKNGLVTFTEREDRACEGTDALARWLLEEHLSLDEGADPGVHVNCPICGGPMRYDSAQQPDLEIRGLKTRRGKIECASGAALSAMSESFFPAGGSTEAGNGGIQSSPAAEDRIRRGQRRLVRPSRPCKTSRRAWVNRRPKPPTTTRIVSLTLEYIRTNAHRMDYARYRREGLPITSAIVESLIEQFNQRVKGTENYGPKAVPKRSYRFVPPTLAKTIGRSGSTNNGLVAEPPAVIGKSWPHERSCTPPLKPI